MLTHQAGKMSRKAQSSESHAGHAEEHLGHAEELKDLVEQSNQEMLKAISKILNSKLASSPTKDEVSALKILLINRD